MLVLSRKIGETLVIDGDVKVTVVRISGNRVALGIEAPDDVRVLRGELQPFDDAEVPSTDGKTSKRAVRRNAAAPLTPPSDPARVNRIGGLLRRHG